MSDQRCSWKEDFFYFNSTATCRTTLYSIDQEIHLLPCYTTTMSLALPQPFLTTCKDLNQQQIRLHNLSLRPPTISQVGKKYFLQKAAISTTYASKPLHIVQPTHHIEPPKSEEDQDQHFIG